MHFPARQLALGTTVAATLLSPALVRAQPVQFAADQTLEHLRGLSIEQLGEVQVTSVSKTPEAVSDAPAAIYVITHQDIVRSGATTIPEILRLAPNLEVAQLNANSYFITARGFNARYNASFSNKMLVLIDGRSVYTPMFGGVYWDMQGVPPEDIERIEVISGPGATLWGANAVNGVVNIITRSSADTPGGRATVGVGNFQRYDLLQYGGRISPQLSYRVYGMFNGFSAYPQANGQAGNDAWNRPQGGFRIDWTPPNDAVTLQGDLFEAAERPADNVRGGNLTAHWRHQFQDGSNLQLLAYYDNAQRFTNNNLGFWVNTYDIELQHNFRMGGWNDVVWGAGERSIVYNVNNIAGLQIVPAHRTLNLANVFVQDTISLMPRLKLTLGVKLEDEPYAGVQLMPSARLAWKATDKLLLWAAVSRAVRSPTPVDTSIREIAGPVDVLNGSTAFRPEILTSYEVGTRARLGERVTFSVSGFYNVYDDLRSIDPGGPGSGSLFQFGNHVAAKVYGVETWGSYQVTSWWRLSAGLSVQHEDVRFLPGSTQAGGLAFIANDPNHQASLRSAMDFGHGVTLDAFLRTVGMLPHPETPGYVELNARLGWAVTSWLTLSLSGFNLLHARHVEFISPDFGAVSVPRSVYGQAAFRF
jgi:iron complex outermembrane receptor protein